MPAVEPSEVLDDLSIDAKISRDVGTSTPTPKAPGFFESLFSERVWGAAIQQENLLGAFAHATEFSGDDPPVAGYNSFKDDTLPDFYKIEFADTFTSSRSPAETIRLRSKVDSELAAREVLADSGWAGFIAMMGAGLISPENLVPFGFIAGPARAAKVGASFMKGAKLAAPAGFVSSLAAEVGLQELQETRGIGESILNVSGATIISGVLGGASAKWLSPLELTDLAKKIEAEEAVARKSIDETGEHNFPTITMMAGEQISMDEFAANAVTQLQKASGAEAPSGRAVKALGALIRTPLMRMYLSGIPKVQNLAARLMSTPIVRLATRDGETMGPSVEAYTDLWRYNVTLERLDMRVEHARYWKEGGTTKYPEFSKGVAMAMRRGDEADFLEDELLAIAVKASANKVRKRFNEMNEQLVAVGLIEPGEVADTAISWLTRVYDQDAVLEGTWREDGTGFGDQAMRWAKETGRATTDEGAREIAEDIIANVKQWDWGLNPDPLQTRSFTVKDVDIEEFLVSDMDIILERLSETMPGKIELARMAPTDTPMIGGLREHVLAARDHAKKGDVLELMLVQHRIENLKTMRAYSHSSRWKTAAKIEALIKKQESLHRNNELLSQQLFDGDEVFVQGIGRALKEGEDDLLRVLNQLEEFRTIAHKELQPAMLKNKDLRAELEGEIRVQLSQDGVTRKDGTVLEIEDKTDIANATLGLANQAVSLRKAEAFDGVQLVTVKKIIRREFAALIDAAPVKKRARIERQLVNTLTDIEHVRKKLLNITGMTEDPRNFFYRAASAIKGLNFVVKGGGFWISSWADLGQIIFTNGSSSFMRTFKAIVADPALLSKVKGADMQRMFLAYNLVGNARRSMRKGDLFAQDPTTAFGRGLAAIQNVFSKAIGLDHHNAYLSSGSSLMVADRIMRDSMAWRAGKLSQARQVQLALAGVNRTMAIRFAKMMDEFGEVHRGGDIEEGVGGRLLLARVEDWGPDNRALARDFGAVVVTDVEKSVLLPGVGEAPRFMADPILSLMGQFRSFQFAAVQRTTLSGMQRRDAQVFQGMMAMVGMGAMIYLVKETLAGRKISDNPLVIAQNAVDRSGILGLYSDYNALVEKATSGRLGASALLGGEVTSRFRARNIIDAAFGPAVGATTDIARVIGAPFKADGPSAGDLHTLRRLMPFQNLFYFRALFDEVEDATAEALGLQE